MRRGASVRQPRGPVPLLDTWSYRPRRPRLGQLIDHALEFAEVALDMRVKLEHTHK